MVELDYLLEIRCDELPSSALEGFARRLANRLFEELVGLGLTPSKLTTGCSPRRLALAIEGLPEHEPDREERELGPPTTEAWDGNGGDGDDDGDDGDGGEPTAALRGFAERVGLELEALVTVKTERGEYVAAVRQVTGRPTAEVLSELVPRIALGLPARFALPWGDDRAEWPTPVRGVVSLLTAKRDAAEEDPAELVPFVLGGVAAGRESAGHPSLSPAPFEVTSAADHRARLTELGIELDVDRRAQALTEAALAAAAALDAELVPEGERALRQLALACEIPGIVEARFDASFLALPPELLVAALTAGPAVVPLHADGTLLPSFLAIADRPGDPHGHVRAGHELAASGRLADARFAYEADRRKPLAELAARAAEAEPSRRLEALVGQCCDELDWQSERESAAEAARLAQVDLGTAVVRRFPQLRGVMGGVYAREEGYVEAIWQGIYDHPLPEGHDDPLPRGRLGQLLGLADRIDRLAAGFAAGRRPTAKLDPLKLRKAARGLLRILLEAHLELDFDLLAARAVRLHTEGTELPAEEVLTSLQAFLRERLRLLFGERGFAHDEIDATLAVRSSQLPDLEARLSSLRDARGQPTFRSLALAAKRVSNILQDQPELELDPAKLAEEAEKELHAATLATRREVEAAAAARRYGDCLERMTALTPLLDRFFVEVLVMDENRELRENRIALLQTVRRLFWSVARLREMATERAEPDAKPDAKPESAKEKP